MGRGVAYLLSWIHGILVFPLPPVSYNDAVRNSERAFFLPSLSSRKITNVGYIFPLCICYDCKATLQIGELLLQLWSLCAMLCQFSLFPRFTTGASARVHRSVDFLINLIGFLVISLVRSARKQAVLVIGILELVRIDVWFFPTSGLGLAVSPQVKAGSGYK